MAMIKSGIGIGVAAVVGIVAVVYAHSDIQVQAAPSIAIRASFVTYDRDLTNKFLAPFNIPRGYMMTALHGTLSTSSKTARMSETLLSLHVATSPQCPENGQNISQYSSIFRQYPSFGLGAIIVKQAGTGTRTEWVDFELPLGVSLNNSCGYIILDGSDLAGGPYKMSVNLSMSLALRKTPTGDLRYSSQDEFILGDDNHDNAFKLTHIWHDAMLYAIFGDIAATAMPGSQYKPPQGRWQVVHQILLYRGGCMMFPNQDQDSNAVRLNQSMEGRPVLYESKISGKGTNAYYQPANIIYTKPIELKKGDCLVHAIHSNASGHAQSGAFNTEGQIFYETTQSEP